MTEPAIEISRFGKSYGGRPAVEDVSFSVPHGSVVGLLGPNGAGKTTILKALVGLVRPTSGSVRIGAGSSERRSPAQVLGFALDPPGMDPGHRVTRHLEIAALLAGVSRRLLDLLRVGVAAVRTVVKAGRVVVREGRITP